ncbi:MAG TPA: glycosyltransferase family 4 protein [Chloroflexia bacterium]|nr:glycosyltransferase family 4 protein [Chloroflexia bacterium]
MAAQAPGRGGAAGHSIAALSPVQARVAGHIPNYAGQALVKVALYNLTTTTRWGGVESFVWEIAAQLAARGHEVKIFGGRGNSELVRHSPGVRVRRFPYIDRDLWRKLPLLNRQYTLTKLLERLSMAPFALPALITGGFDVVHIQKPYDLPVGVLGKLSGAKLLFGCHGKDFWMGDRLFVRFVDGAVSASHFNASQVRARYGISPVVVYNGVDLERFTPDGARDGEVLAKYGLEAPSLERPALLYAGRLVRWKGVEYLIKALPLVAPKSTVLWIAGEGTYEGTLRELAERLGVAGRVRFLGKVEQDELAALYRSCAMLVATSFVNETFGMALCEAMACGTAVVASNFGGFKEVVEAGVTGLLARPQDQGDLAQKINSLLANPAMAREMGRAGRERVLTTFSWEAVADRLEEVYGCLVPSST